jgi:hypothetical protein
MVYFKKSQGPVCLYVTWVVFAASLQDSNLPPLAYLTLFSGRGLKLVKFYSPFRGSIDGVTIAWGKSLIFDISPLFST